jgi:hypothetical protein
MCPDHGFSPDGQACVFLPRHVSSGVSSGDVTLALGSTQPMLIASPCGLTSTVEIRYNLATHVDHLALPVDPDTRDRIVA